MLVIQNTPTTQKLTYANMIAISSPSDGQEVYVTDNQIKRTFSFNSNTSLWEHPSFLHLENGAVSTTMTIGMVVVLASAEDDACNFSNTTFDNKGIGVVAIGGAINTDILVQYQGKATANIQSGSTHNAQEFVCASNLSGAGNALVSTTATGSDFARTLEVLGSGDTTCKIVMYNVPR